jgi:hypothetical protein
VTEVVDKALVLLGDIPGYLYDDEYVRAFKNAVARELQRIEDFMLAVRLGIFPQHADDELGFLEIYERLFGLAIKPPGVTVEQRRATILAHFRKRHSAAGSDWEAAIDGILGTSWTYVEEPSLYRVTITIPHGPGTVQAGQVESLVREVTPAHLEVRILFSTGFQVGINLVGPDRL